MVDAGVEVSIVLVVAKDTGGLVTVLVVQILVLDRGRSVVRLLLVAIGLVGRVTGVVLDLGRDRRRVGSVSPEDGRVVGGRVRGLDVGLFLSPTLMIQGFLVPRLGASVTRRGSSTGQ